MYFVPLCLRNADDSHEGAQAAVEVACVGRTELRPSARGCDLPGTTSGSATEITRKNIDVAIEWIEDGVTSVGRDGAPILVPDDSTRTCSGGYVKASSRRIGDRGGGIEPID